MNSHRLPPQPLPVGVLALENDIRSALLNYRFPPVQFDDIISDDSDDSNPSTASSPTDNDNDNDEDHDGRVGTTASATRRRRNDTDSIYDDEEEDDDDDDPFRGGGAGKASAALRPMDKDLGESLERVDSNVFMTGQVDSPVSPPPPDHIAALINNNNSLHHRPSVQILHQTQNLSMQQQLHPLDVPRFLHHSNTTNNSTAVSSIHRSLSLASDDTQLEGSSGMRLTTMQGVSSSSSPSSTAPASVIFENDAEGRPLSFSAMQLQSQLFRMQQEHQELQNQLGQLQFQQQQQQMQRSQQLHLPLQTSPQLSSLSPNEDRSNMVSESPKDSSSAASTGHRRQASRSLKQPPPITTSFITPTPIPIPLPPGRNPQLTSTSSTSSYPTASSSTSVSNKSSPHASLTSSVVPVKSATHPQSSHVHFNFADADDNASDASSGHNPHSRTSLEKPQNQNQNQTQQHNQVNAASSFAAQRASVSSSPAKHSKDGGIRRSATTTPTKSSGKFGRRLSAFMAPSTPTTPKRRGSNAALKTPTAGEKVDLFPTVEMLVPSTSSSKKDLAAYFKDANASDKSTPDATTPTATAALSLTPQKQQQQNLPPQRASMPARKRADSSAPSLSSSNSGGSMENPAGGAGVFGLVQKPLSRRTSKQQLTRSLSSFSMTDSPQSSSMQAGPGIAFMPPPQPLSQAQHFAGESLSAKSSTNNLRLQLSHMSSQPHLAGGGPVSALPTLQNTDGYFESKSIPHNPFTNPNNQQQLQQIFNSNQPLPQQQPQQVQQQQQQQQQPFIPSEYLLQTLLTLPKTHGLSLTVSENSFDPQQSLTQLLMQGRYKWAQSNINGSAVTVWRAVMAGLQKYIAKQQDQTTPTSSSTAASSKMQSEGDLTVTHEYAPPKGSMAAALRSRRKTFGANDVDAQRIQRENRESARVLALALNLLSAHVLEGVGVRKDPGLGSMCLEVAVEVALSVGVTATLFGAGAVSVVGGGPIKQQQQHQQQQQQQAVVDAPEQKTKLRRSLSQRAAASSSSVDASMGGDGGDKSGGKPTRKFSLKLRKKGGVGGDGAGESGGEGSSSPVDMFRSVSGVKIRGGHHHHHHQNDNNSSNNVHLEPAIAIDYMITAAAWRLIDPASIPNTSHSVLLRLLTLRLAESHAARASNNARAKEAAEYYLRVAESLGSTNATAAARKGKETTTTTTTHSPMMVEGDEVERRVLRRINSLNRRSKLLPVLQGQPQLQQQQQQQVVVGAPPPVGGSVGAYAARQQPGGYVSTMMAPAVNHGGNNNPPAIMPNRQQQQQQQQQHQQQMLNLQQQYEAAMMNAAAGIPPPGTQSLPSSSSDVSTGSFSFAKGMAMQPAPPPPSIPPAVHSHQYPNVYPVPQQQQHAQFSPPNQNTPMNQHPQHHVQYPNQPYPPHQDHFPSLARQYNSNNNNNQQQPQLVHNQNLNNNQYPMHHHQLAAKASEEQLLNMLQSI